MGVSYIARVHNDEPVIQPLLPPEQVRPGERDDGGGINEIRDGDYFPRSMPRAAIASTKDSVITVIRSEAR